MTGGGISFAGVGGGGGDKDADELADWGVDSGDETAGDTTDDGVALAGEQVDGVDAAEGFRTETDGEYLDILKARSTF